MTLKEIAKQANVSISTVSRIINGRNTSAASKQTQEKIWQIALENGYTPNASAQSLKTGKKDASSKAIVCVFARSQNVKNDLFFSALTRGIEQQTLKEGFIHKYSLYAYDLDSPAYTNQIEDATIDGAIILGRCDQKTIDILKQRYKKIVYTGLNPLSEYCDQVVCDGYAMAADAVKYLISLGHTHIGYIGETNNEIRFKAYCDILNENKLPVNSKTICNVSLSTENGYKGAKTVLERTSEVTAFFCTNDITAIGAIKGIKETGYLVPSEISVISIDDIDIAQYVSPMLTTMHVPTAELGRMAAKILIDRIHGGHSLPMKVALPYHMVKRESCAKFH